MPTARNWLSCSACLALTLLASNPLFAAAPPLPRLDRYGDPIPAGAVARLGSLRLRHPAMITFLSATPDGKSVVAKSDYGPIVVWDVRTGRAVRSWGDDTVHVTDGFALSPDGKTLAVSKGRWSDNHMTVQLRDLQTGKERLQLSNGPAGIYFLKYSRDGKSLVSIGRQMAVAVWDLATGKQRGLMGNESSHLKALDLSPDGRTVVARGEQDIRLLDLTTGKERLLGKHDRVVYSAAFSPDGRWVASGSNDGTARLWDVAGRQPGRVFKHVGAVYHVAFSPDGKRLASAPSFPGEVHIWDVQTGALLHRLSHLGQVHTMTFLPEGEGLVTGGQDCRVRIWDLASGRERHPAEGSGPVRTAPAFSPNGQRIALHTDTTIEVWGTEDGRLRRTLCVGAISGGIAWQADSIRFQALKTDESYLSPPGVLQLDAITGKVLRSVRSDNEDFSALLAVSPDGRWIATGGGRVNAPLRLFDIAPGKRSVHDPAPSPVCLGFGGPAQEVIRIDSLAFSPDSRFLATCKSSARVIRLWDVPGKTCVWRSELVDDRPTDAVFSPAGSVLGVATSNGKIHLLEAETGKEICVLTAFREAANSVAFSPDGHFLVADGIDAAPRENARTRVWELASGRQVAELKGAYPAVSLDGRWLATVEETKTTLIWDARAIIRTPTPSPSEDPARLWDELACPHRARAYRAAWRMARSPELAIPLLRAELGALRWPEADQVPKLVRRLDSDQFTEREGAEKALERMGATCAPFLRQVLADKLSLETHRRIQRVLARVAHLEPPAKRQRAERAVLALELMGTPSAQAVLHELAHPDSRAGLRQQAAAALVRLEVRLANRKP